MLISDTSHVSSTVKTLSSDLRLSDVLCRSLEGWKSHSEGLNSVQTAALASLNSREWRPPFGDWRELAAEKRDGA